MYNSSEGFSSYMTPQMKRMLTIVGIVLGIIFLWYIGKQLFFTVAISLYEPPPVTISSSTATTKVWQSYLTSVGSLAAVNGTDISAEVSGIVSEVHFDSGQVVQQGDLLLLLDADVEKAQLKSDEAQLKLAQINYDRTQALLKKSVTSQADFDTVSAHLQEAQASVEGTKARIKQKTITAPFSGNIGIRLVNIGQYVSAGTAMVTLQSLDPLYVQFNLPEQYLTKLYINEPVSININNADNKNAVQGTITAINSKVDQTTRNILVQATIPNKDTQLYPGMFALVKIWLRGENNIITLPQTAISYSLHGDAVYIIKPKETKTESKRASFEEYVLPVVAPIEPLDNLAILQDEIVHYFHLEAFMESFHVNKKKKPEKPIITQSTVLHAYRQYVKVGERRGDEVSILDGIKEGDIVATSGQLKLQNGTRVVIDNSVEL